MAFPFLIALFTFAAIFLMPVFSCDLRKNRSVLFGYWFVTFLHQAAAFTNAFLFTTLGADADAATFHRTGKELAQLGSFSFAIGSEFYENMLGFVYWVLGPSLLLGEQLSILAFAVSCIVLMKILRLLGLLTYGAPILLVFGALPTIVLFGSVTLRESYQVLFFMLAVYFGIKMRVKGGINIYLVALVVSSLVMGLFHQVLLVYGVFLIVLFKVYALWSASHFRNITKACLMAVLVISACMAGAVALIKQQISGLDALTALVNMNMLEVVLNYRNSPGIVLGRADYDVSLDFSSPFTGIRTGFLLYVHYLFAPFPWQVRNVLDVYASMESILRMVLIYFSVKHWRKACGEQRRLLGLMLILFFSMSFMWAMGTLGYGTATRHHMLSWWIIVVVGLPLLMAKLTRFLPGSTARRCSYSLERDEKTS